MEARAVSRKEATREGLEGISPRYIQDKISNALVANHRSNCINPFMVMNELETGLDHHSLISDPELKKQYRDLLLGVHATAEARGGRGVEGGERVREHVVALRQEVGVLEHRIVEDAAGARGKEAG